MKLSERMHTRVHCFLMNTRDESLVPATSTEILKWIGEVVQLEAELELRREWDIEVSDLNLVFAKRLAKLKMRQQ